MSLTCGHTSVIQGLGYNDEWYIYVIALLLALILYMSSGFILVPKSVCVIISPLITLTRGHISKVNVSCMHDKNLSSP